MLKLTIPLSPLLGSPLTDEELKSIVGGQIEKASRVCSCTYQVGYLASEAEIVVMRITNVDGEDDCRSKCRDACMSENGSYCPDYHIKYTSIL